MPLYIRDIINRLFFALGVILIAGCSRWETPGSASDAEPLIFPDYKEVTIPCNIAPLNFMIEGVSRIQTVISLDGAEQIRVSGKEGVIAIPLKKWSAMMESAQGKALEFEVSAWSEENPEGVKYAPFKVNVADDAIDPWVAYRLIEPAYKSWRQLGLFQRNLSTFEEKAIVTNTTDIETCINCHLFPAYSAGSMMFHARGRNGGTILYHDGEISKIKFNEIGPKKNTTYPAWHPDGRMIAFSSNNTRQSFYVHGEKPIEVYDYTSDLLLYDTQTGEVLTDPRFMTEETLETFPAWSPDGRTLYYVASDQKNVPAEVEQLHYHILSVSYDPSNRTFGEKIDTLYNAHKSGGSASYPRISADGRYLLYTWSEYGTFPVWHQEADLKMMDLTTGEHVDVSVWNDPDEADSYHSWSSDGRWVAIGSRRLDGRYTRLYFAYLDRDGKAHKPFLLPQEDPRHDLWRLKSYNIPEFIDSEVVLPDSVAELFEPEK